MADLLLDTMLGKLATYLWMCGQHFWRGSHWDDVTETLAEVW